MFKKVDQIEKKKNSLQENQNNLQKNQNSLQENQNNLSLFILYQVNCPTQNLISHYALSGAYEISIRPCENFGRPNSPTSSADD